MADMTAADIRGKLNISFGQEIDLRAIAQGMTNAAAAVGPAGQDDFYRSMRRFGDARDNKVLKPLLQDVGNIAVSAGLTKDSTTASISARLQHEDPAAKAKNGELTFQFKGPDGTCKDLTVAIAQSSDGSLFVADRVNKSGILGASHDTGYSNPQARKITAVDCKL